VAALPPLRPEEKEPEAKTGVQPNAYSVEANSLVFTKPAKVAAEPPMLHKDVETTKSSALLQTSNEKPGKLATDLGLIWTPGFRYIDLLPDLSSPPCCRRLLNHHFKVTSG
jgi:hypothetical protein